MVHAFVIQTIYMLSISSLVGSQVSSPSIVEKSIERVPVGFTVHIVCSTDDVDITYTLDGTYPSLQNDSAELYDADVGVVFELPGAYLVRALASKEDMMPSEVMTSSLILVTEQPTGETETRSITANNEMNDAQATIQSHEDAVDVESLEDASVSDESTTSWAMPDLVWEAGSVEGSGTISWPLLDWMEEEIATFALFVDGVLYCETPAVGTDVEGHVIPCNGRVELQDLELGHVYRAVLLARQGGSGVVAASDELSFVASHDETGWHTHSQELGDAMIESAVTDDEKMQRIIGVQQTAGHNDEDQSSSVAEVDANQLDSLLPEFQAEGDGTVEAVDGVDEISGRHVEQATTEEVVDGHVECQMADSMQVEDESQVVVSETHTVTMTTVEETEGQQTDGIVSKETKQRELAEPEEDCKETGETVSINDGRTEDQNGTVRNISRDATIESTADEISIDNRIDIDVTAVDVAVADDTAVGEIVAVTTATSETTPAKTEIVEIAASETTTAKTATVEIATSKAAGLEYHSCDIGSTVAPQTLSKLWIKDCSPGAVQFAWESVIWDFSDGGSLLLRVEGKQFSSNVDSVSTYASGGGGDECSESPKTLLVHSWKIGGVECALSVAGCLAGCSYKAWLCADTATAILSEPVEFTIPFPPEAPALQVLNITDNTVTVSWLEIRLSPGAVLKRFQVYRDGKAAGPPLSSSALETMLARFEEGTPCLVSVAAIVLPYFEWDGKQMKVEEQILHSDPLTIYKPVRPSKPEVTHQPVDQYGAIGIAWKMPAGRTEATVFDILVDGVSYQTVPVGFTLDTNVDAFMGPNQVNGQQLCAETGTGGRDSGISDEEISLDHGSVGTRHSFVLTGCQPRKAYRIAVVALVGDKVIEMESGRAVILPCVSLESNCVSAVCASVPNPPKLRLDNVDHMGISFSWDRPDEFGEARISGYLVEVNKHRQVMLDENAQSFSLTDCEIGRKYHFTVTALTHHACSQGNNAITDERDVILTKTLGDVGYDADTETSLLATPKKPRKTHIESLSSNSSIRTQFPRCLPSQPLTVRYSGFVLPPTDLAVSELHANSVVISWMSGKPQHQEMQATKELRWSDMPQKTKKHVLEPEKFLVRWWKCIMQSGGQEPESKATEMGEQRDETIVCKTVVKASYSDRHSVVLSPLEVQAEYCVTVESQARLYTSPHSTRYVTLKARSEPFDFGSAKPPSSVLDLRITSISFTQIALSWSPPVERGMAVKCLEVDVQSMDGVVLAQKFIPIPAVTCLLDSLQPNCQYTLTVYSHTRMRDKVEQKGMGGTKYMPASMSVVGCTLGLTPTSRLEVVSKNPNTVSLTWWPATPHGPAFIDKYIVQWQETASTLQKCQALSETSSCLLQSISTLDVCRDFEWSSQIVSREDCNCTIGRLIAGVTYSCRVVTVLESTMVSSESSLQASSTEAVPNTFWHVGDSINVHSSVAVGKPRLLVTAYTTTSIQLYWPKPKMCIPVRVNDQGRFVEEMEGLVYNPRCKGVVSVLKSYRVKVDGSLLATLDSEQSKYIVTGRELGSTCCLALEALSYGEGMRKKRAAKSRAGGVSSSDDFDISSSDDVILSLPQSESCPIVSLSCHFTSLSLSYDTEKILCDESKECACGVIAIEWQIPGENVCSSAIRKFIVRWSSDKNPTQRSVSLSANTHCYDLQSPLQKDVYSVSIEAVSSEDTESYISPVVQCQVPGPPDPPQLWLHSANEDSLTIAWSEPQTYSSVKIKGYQTYINGKKTGNLLETVHRKAAIPYRKHKKYEIAMVAVSDSIEFGNSLPSCPLLIDGATLSAAHNPVPTVKKVQFANQPESIDDTSVVAAKPFDRESSGMQQKKERLKATKKSIARKLPLQVDIGEVTGDSISLDWTKFIPSDDVICYEIQWSSVASPSSKKVVIRAEEHSHTLTGCQKQTSHFIRVLALGDGDFVLARSKQLTVQTAAPPGPPDLRVGNVSGCNVVVEWQRPELFGPTHLIGYKLRVECSTNVEEIELSAATTAYTMKCRPCELHTFSVKGMTLECGDGLYSPSVSLTCDGIVPSPLTSLPTGMVGTVRVRWDPPKIHGNIKIKSYKIFWLIESDANPYDMSVSDIIENAAVVCHGPLKSSVSGDQLTNIPSGCCWVVAGVYSSQAEVAYSVPLKAYPARPPKSPVITVTVVNLDERKKLEVMARQLVSQRDSLQLKLHWQKSKQSRRAVKKREAEVSKLAHTLAATEKELMSCLRSLQQHTGYVSMCVSWERPWDDGDATVSGYQLIVDGSPWGRKLLSSSNDVKVKLGIGKSTYQVQMTTLCKHPVGNSIPGNAVSISTVDFQPFSVYCFCNVHEEGSVWPDQGSCSYLDSLTYELTRLPTDGSAVYPHLGFLAPHPIQSPCNVFDLSDSKWRNLIGTSVDMPMPTQVLFWTRWCRPSLTAVELFVKLADELHGECHFVACCIDSAGGHSQLALCQLIQQTLTERKLDRPPDVLRHAVAESNSGMAEATLNVLGVVGVPTWICIHPAGYVGWQGRIVFDLYEDLRAYIDDVLDMVLGRKEYKAD